MFEDWKEQRLDWILEGAAGHGGGDGGDLCSLDGHDMSCEFRLRDCTCRKCPVLPRRECGRQRLNGSRAQGLPTTQQRTQQCSGHGYLLLIVSVTIDLGAKGQIPRVELSWRDFLSMISGPTLGRKIEGDERWLVQNRQWVELQSSWDAGTGCGGPTPVRRGLTGLSHQDGGIVVQGLQSTLSSSKM